MEVAAVVAAAVVHIEHVSLGRKIPFALLKLELRRCWRKHYGCYCAGHLVDQDEGDGLCCRPAFETDSIRYYRGDWYFAGFTTILFGVLGEVFSPTSFPCVYSNLESMAWRFAV